MRRLAMLVDQLQRGTFHEEESDMQTTEVKREQLLETLRKNRADHQGVYEAAERKYRDEVVKRLEALLEDARAGKKFSLTIGLVRPTSHQHDYDRAILMLEMSVKETIVLTAAEFEQYVMDRWHWARDFGATSAFYGVANKYVDPSALPDPDGE